MRHDTPGKIRPDRPPAQTIVYATRRLPHLRHTRGMNTFRYSSRPWISSRSGHQACPRSPHSTRAKMPTLVPPRSRRNSARSHARRSHPIRSWNLPAPPAVRQHLLPPGHPAIGGSNHAHPDIALLPGMHSTKEIRVSHRPLGSNHETSVNVNGFPENFGGIQSAGQRTEIAFVPPFVPTRGCLKVPADSPSNCTFSEASAGRVETNLQPLDLCTSCQ